MIDDFWDDENTTDTQLTPILCLACEGKYQTLFSTTDGRHIMTRCRWCTNGAMTREQMLKWNKYYYEKEKNKK